LRHANISVIETCMDMSMPV